jgi:hypothetical protein
MSIKNRKEFSKKEIEEAILSTHSMSGAAKHLKVDWRTFRWNAEKYGLYSPSEPGMRQKFNLEDILSGKHPQYSTSHLSKRLIREGLKEYKCECCGISDWNGMKISLELNHKNGDNSNHTLSNLELLCPNCHSQTDTYRNKRGKGEVSRVGLAAAALKAEGPERGV